jgi:hypothetical protein
MEFNNINIMRNIKWTDEDKVFLGKTYTSSMFQLALEKADMNKDKAAFDYIFDKQPSLAKYHTCIW